MRKIMFSTMLLTIASAVSAQMTPEAVMAALPQMPTVAEMIRYEKESLNPDPKKEMTQPNLYIDFHKALKSAKDRTDEQIKNNVSTSVERKIMNSKVAGSNYTVAQMEAMSEAEQERVANQIVQNKLKGYGISQADMAKMQSGNMSKADEEAMANRMIQQMTGGMTMSDIQMMQGMTDKERAQFMQASGLAEQTQAKAKENKQNAQKNANLNALIQQMQKCDRQLNELNNRMLKMDNEVKQAGRELYKQSYEQQVAKWDAVFMEAVKEGAFSEKYTEEERPMVEAAQRKADNAANQKWILLCDFYTKYIPTWRNMIVKKMDMCRSQMMPLLVEKKNISDNLYKITQDAGYAQGEIYPYIAASSYLDIPFDIDKYDPFEQ